MAIDTLKVAKRLREAGFDEAQAEAVIAAVQDGAESSDVATKLDLALVNARLDALSSHVDARIDSLASTLDARLADAKSEILYRVFQMILGAVLINVIAMLGVMFAFAKLLGH
ncbi:MAG TPA: hypothetical protein VND95_03920 [Stellaceae bacterium]|nr:hypothetical protein [Stellaceae bacterium]